jgi:arylsulfatase A-like enzyme
LDKKIFFRILVVLIIFAVGVIGWRLLFHGQQRYVGGDVISLIDALKDESVRMSPLKMNTYPVRKEPLSHGWKKVAALKDGISIWRTYSSRFIVSPSDGASDSTEKVYQPNKALRYQADLFRPDTPADCWSHRDNQVFISLGPGQDPNGMEYFIDYKSFNNLKPAKVRGEKLQKPITLSITHDGHIAQKLVAYPLENALWTDGTSESINKIIVRRNGRVLPFQEDLPAEISLPPENSFFLFSLVTSVSKKPFMLASAADRLKKAVDVPPGPYILSFTARAALAGPDPPLAVIRISGRELARLPITTEDWQTFYIRVRIRKSPTEFCFEFPNDYFDPQTLQDRNIFISEIQLWPAQDSSRGPRAVSRASAAPGAWSYLDDSREVLYEATPLGMFQMFTPKDVFASRRYWRPGMASFMIRAKGDLAGKEKPALGFYLDRTRIGKIQVTENTFREYRLENIPLAAGWHEIRLVFENDFYDPKTRQDRNIFLTNVSLDYSSAVLIREPADISADSYTISYPTKAPHLFQLRLYRLLSGLEGKGNNPVAGPIDQAGQIRNSLICPPPTKLAYRIQVPVAGKLRLSYGAHFPDTSPSPKKMAAGSTSLAIKVHGAFHSSLTLFAREIASSRQNPANPWQEIDIELGRLAGKKIELTIETRAVGERYFNCPLIFIGNPVISSASPRSARKPSIILISADALRPDHLGCYGYGRNTSPNIDQLARDSVLFENAVSQASWTLPSVSSLFTSLYPSFCGVHTWNTRLPSSEITLPRILRRNGYTTAACINNPLLIPAYGLSQGFDLYDYLDSNMEEQLETVSRWLEVMKNQSFFLYVHLLSPHTPYEAPDPFCRAFGQPEHPKLGTTTSAINELERSGRKLTKSDLDYLIAQYDGSILYLDDFIKRLLDRLKHLDLYDTSLVILFSDHGEQFQEHGHLTHCHSLYQEEIRIPLIMKPPSGSGLKALRIPGLVRSIDLLPTILDFLKIKPLDFAQGKSLWPLLWGKSYASGATFAELNVFGILAITKGRFKYVYTDPDIYAQTQKNPDFPRLSIKFFEELYDLEGDPGEKSNLVDLRPDLIRLFRRERLRFFENAALFRKDRFGSQETNRIVLDQSMKERLRALGYLR